MGRKASFESLLKRLYATGVDAQGVPEWLHALKAPFNSHVTSIYFHDPGHRLRDAVHATDLDTDEFIDRLAKIGNQHLWFERGAPTIVREGVSDAECLVGEYELLHSPFYQDFLRLMDIRHGMALGMHVGSGGELAAVTINRNPGAGPFQPEDMRFARRLLPHVRNVYALQRQLSWMESLLGGFRAALDRLPTGAVLLDRHGRITFRNQEAMRLCAGHCGLSERAGHPAAVWPSDQEPLRQLVERTVVGWLAAAPQAVLLHDADGRPAATAIVLPVPPHTTLAWSETAVAAVMFVRPVRPRQPSIEALRTLFGFTAAETELAALLAEGLTLPEISERLGKRRNTLRTQMRALLAKTGARRQAELVQLLAQTVASMARDPSQAGR
jgi:DNA-binding CsgD family transcriptional regulator